MKEVFVPPASTLPRATALSYVALVAIFAFAVSCLYFAYSLAQGLTWQFDDYANLKTLADASSPAGVLNFVFGGVAGPLGRPLSLATFLASYSDWPTNPWGMVQLTFVIHALNGALVFLLIHRVLNSPSLRAVAGANSMALALATSLLWMCLPIHASSVLMPIQRMTHVCAFFSLVSLYGFIVLRQHQGGTIPSYRGMLLVSLWLTFSVLLAVFAKENGITTITFAALIELFCFYPTWKSVAIDTRSRLWRLWLASAAFAVILVMLVHVSTRWPDLRESFELYRGYSWNEHISTQWVISLEYLRQIFMPRSAQLGPFHDNHAVYTWGELAAYFALVFWGSLLWLTAWLGSSRHRTRTVRTLGWTGCAAILWFFAGHQVESTLLPLELYFEHRNYLSSLAGCMLLVLVFNYFLGIAHNRVVPLSLAAVYIVYLAASLVQLTSLWGQPMLAHDLWQKSHPNSTRAAQSVIQDLIESGYQEAAFKFANEFINEKRALDISIQVTALRCKHLTRDEQERGFVELLQLVSELKTPGGISTGLAGLGTSVRSGDCISPSELDYEDFLHRLLMRPQVAHAVKVRHHIFYELALMAKQRDDMSAYIKFLQKAFWDYPTLTLAQLIAATLFQEHRINDAIDWIDLATRDAPNASLRKAWRDTLQSMRSALVDIQKSLQETEPVLNLQPSTSQ